MIILLIIFKYGILKQNSYFFSLSPPLLCSAHLSLSLSQTSRILSTISEQSQLLSPKKLLALQRQTSLYSPLPPRSPGTVETPGNSSENLSFSDSAADISSAKGNSIVPAMSVGDTLASASLAPILIS